MSIFYFVMKLLGYLVLCLVADMALVNFFETIKPEGIGLKSDTFYYYFVQ
jgi:hypothetical protein